MESGRRTSVRTKFGVMVMLMGLLSGLLAMTASAVEIPPDPAGATTGGFEIDGNMLVDGTGTLDWGSFVGSAVVRTDDTEDSGVAGQENEPENYECNVGGANPGKSNFLRIYANTRLQSSDPFLDLGYIRDATTGNTHLNFEFNKLTTATYQFPAAIDTPEEQAAYGGAPGGPKPCPFVNRSVDDLLVTYDYPGGDAPADVNLYEWDGDNWIVVPDGELPVPLGAASTADGNAQTVTDPLGGGSFDGRAFGEFSLNLEVLDGLVGGGVLGCPGFATMNVRSRSSGESFNSNLQDRLATIPFNLSNCAKIKIKKVDNSVPPVAQQGAVYGLYDTLAKAQAVAGQTDAQAVAAAVSTCTTVANGTCELINADPAKDYWITEITPPAGLLPSTEIRAVTAAQLEPFSTLDLSSAPFVNNVPVGNVTITKRLFNDANNNGVLDAGEQVTPDQASDLDGISFALQQSNVTSTTHPANLPATCTITGGTGQCTISSVRLGTYQILETLNPNGPSGIGVGTSPSVTITTNGQTVTANYDNPLSPINIALDKLGDKDQASIGDTVNYTFTVTTTGVRLHDVTLVEWEGFIDPVTYADICDSGPTFDAALSTGEPDGFLNAGDSFIWKCPHVVTPSDPDPLPNRAHANGTDDVGRTADAYDIFNVDILYPDLRVVKLAADGVDEDSAASANEAIDAPGTASYTITVTNIGSGIARNATLTDDLPPGAWTVTQTSETDVGDECPVSDNPNSVSFTCNFGDLAAGASKTVTVSRTVTIATDCAAVLVNNAGVATTYQEANIDPNAANDESSATITVRCPDVGVVKTAFTTPINAGDRAVWTITVTNNGDGVATDVHLTDTIPLGLTEPAIGGDDAEDCDLDGNVVSCDFGDIGAGGTRTITVSGLTEAADCDSIPNTATVVNANGGTYVDSNALNNSSTANVVVQCPDVHVDKSGPAEVSAGDQITWSITFGNSGIGDAYDVTLTDQLPDGLTGYQLTDDDEVCVLAGSTVTCTFEVLEAGDSHTISVTGTTGTSSPEDCGNVVNPVSISASNEATGTIRLNNTDSVTTDVECPEVNLVKVADDPSTVSAGDPVGFGISVSNEDAEDVGIARDVVVTDTLPEIPGYTWDFDNVVSDEEAPCSLVGLELTCDFGDLSPGETASVHVFATQDGETDPEDACGTYPNTGTVTLENGTEADVSDNSASVTILCPGVNLGKVADDAIVEAGDQIGFTITVTNLDDGEPPAEGVAKDVVVIDDLPGDFAWTIAGDSDLPEGADCSIDDGTLTCELGDLPAIDGEGAPQVTIHLVADTTEADCAVYDNTASVTVANGVDPDDDSATSQVRCPISIQLDKTGDTIAHVGDVVDYEFTATNTGGEDLIDVQLTDPECDAGTITLVDDADGDTTLAAGTWDTDSESFVGGEVWGYTCSRTLTAADIVVVDGADFALNTGSVRGEDVDGREATDTDPHAVEIITPVIQVVKTVDDATPDIGQTVTFTYVVTNTGDTTLFNVQVVDDQLGAIGTIAQLAAGASTTLTKTMVVAANSPTRNVATATGADVLGKSVTDDDDATITIVLPAVIERPAPVVAPAQLPRTGSDAQLLLLLSGALLLLGGLLVASGEGWALRTVRRRQG